MTYRFDIQHHTNGNYTATCGDMSAASDRALARKLLEADAEDGPIDGGRVGKRDWTFPSLHAFAAGTLSETDVGFRHGVYAIHPHAPNQTMHPALQHAVSSLRLARQTALERLAATRAAARAGKPSTARHGGG